MLKKHFEKSRNKGDTLVEVLFAVAVFSLVAVGAMSIMNQGTATAERALEITLVRQQIDAQAETLRYLNASYIAAVSMGGVTSDWQSIQSIAKTTASNFNSTNCNVPLNNVFILNTHAAKFEDPTVLPGKPVSAKTYSQVHYSGDNVLSVEGIWIEPVRSDRGPGNQSNSGYIDFHIRACWDGPGQSVPVTLGTIVRLYEPR